MFPHVDYDSSVLSAGHMIIIGFFPEKANNTGSYENASL
jgi:hypothetical protein